MKKIFLFLIIPILSIFADSVEFNGVYKSSEITKEWKKKNPSRMGFVGGCIYSGQLSNRKLIKVYTEEACRVSTKSKRSGSFYCELLTNYPQKSLEQGTYEMWHGTCDVLNQ